MRPQFRRDKLWRREVLVTPGRISVISCEPHAGYANEEMVSISPVCPFCPGNEHENVGEWFREEGNTGWQVRGFQNKFPMLGDPLEKRVRLNNAASGRCGIIVTTPEHNLGPSKLSSRNMVAMLDAVGQYVRRETEKYKLSQWTLYQNYGAVGGASQPHPHWQIVGFQRASRSVLRRQKYFVSAQKRDGCLVCNDIDKAGENGLSVFESQYFSLYVPWAPSMAFHLRLAPNSDFCDASFFRDVCTNAELRADFYETLKQGLARLKSVLQGNAASALLADPAFRLVLVELCDCHFFFELCAPVSLPASLEWFSMTPIVTANPQVIATRLRSAQTAEA